MPGFHLRDVMEGEAFAPEECVGVDFISLYLYGPEYVVQAVQNIKKERGKGDENEYPQCGRIEQAQNEEHKAPEQGTDDEAPGVRARQPQDELVRSHLFLRLGVSLVLAKHQFEKQHNADDGDQEDAECEKQWG